MSAPPPGPPPVVPNIAEITAPLLLGSLWNWTLYGVLVTQFYVYTYNFPNDSKRLKYLACGIFLTETVQAGLALCDIYYWFASGFGDLANLAKSHFSVWDGPLLGSVTCTTVQYFFAYRIWALSGKKSWRLCLMICFFSAVAGVSEFSGGIYSKATGEFARGRVLKNIAIVWLSGSVLADGLIALSMIYHLEKRRTDGHGFLSNSAISRIVRLTVETNLFTTSVAIIALVLIVVKPDKDWFTCPTAIIGKLYANSLFASLNNRIAIREGAARKAAMRSPNATDSGVSRSKGTSDFHLDKPPSAIKLISSRETVRESRESEGRDDIIDIA